jgi:serine/threonine protein kinase/lipopolysaccharide biosynthesis regulator YciM
MSVFGQALERASPEERAAYLDAVCRGDAAMRARLEALLRADQEAGDFLRGSSSAASPAATVDELIREGPGTVIAPYKLLEQIGEGGFGVVFMAEQHEPVRRKVALKLLKPGMDTCQVIARFEAERQALALMDHPNIAKILDAGQTTSGRPYFAMDLVKGLPITAYCDQSQLTPRQRLELFIPACQAVQHAHQKGIIHRDLKPSNVLVTLYDGAPLVKIIDFGIAKALGQQLTDKTLFTGFAQLLGTPLYMSPEQAALSNVDVDTRSDIYSLGVLLYELLTGATPFDKERFKEAGYDEMRRIIREEEPPKPSTRVSTLGQAATTVSAQRQSDPKKLSRHLRGELDWIVMKCLEKDRNRRYETANDLARDLQRYLAGEPVLAGPPSATYQLQKLVRRNKGRVVAALLLFLALVGGIIGTSMGMVQARRSAESERLAKDTAEQRLKQVERANEILASVFSDLNPRVEGKGGPDLRVLLGQRLEKAAQVLEGESVGDALRVARLQNLLGNSLHELGHLDQAQPLLEKALQTYEDRLGADHRDTLTCKNNLGRLYRTQGKYHRAEPLYQDVLQGNIAEFGASHPETLAAKFNVATLYLYEGKYDRAEPLYHELVQALTTTLGADHDNTLEAKHRLAELYAVQGKYDRAEPLLLEVVPARTEKLGADHLGTLRSKNSLAELYRALHKYEQAEPLYLEVLRAKTAKLGEDHPSTLISKNNLALLYLETGKLDRSIPLLEQVLSRQKAKLGLDHPDTVVSMANLGIAYREAGRLADAIPLLEDALQRVRKRPSPVPADLTLALSGLAEAYDRAGEIAKAEPLCRELVKQGRTAGALEYLARNLLHQQKYVEAELLLRECAQVHEQKLPDGWETFNVKSMLGESLLGQQKYAEAEPLLIQGYEGMKQREGRMSALSKVRLVEAVERLVQLYGAWGKKDEAKKWRATLEGMKVRKDAKES